METVEFFARRLLLQGRGVFGHAVHTATTTTVLIALFRKIRTTSHEYNVIRVSFAVQN
jgi:hypothetical protein